MFQEFFVGLAVVDPQTTQRFAAQHHRPQQKTFEFLGVRAQRFGRIAIAVQIRAHRIEIVVRLDVTKLGRPVFAVGAGERVRYRESLEGRQGQSVGKPILRIRAAAWSTAWPAARATLCHPVRRHDLDELGRD